MGNYLKFWGTRGSCPVSGPQYRAFGGSTSCLEVRYGETLAIIDAGTGILPLGNQLFKEEVRKIHLFFSHLHWDHLLGFPFFKPLYRPDVEIIISAPQGSGRTPKELFEQLFAEEFFPVKLDKLPAKLEFRTIEARQSIEMGAIEIDFQPALHAYATFCFKVTTPREIIGYATDNELTPPLEDSRYGGLIDFFQGCDLLIHEMQYSKEEHQSRRGWGHSSPMGLLSFLERVRPGRWFVTHHDPDHTDRDLKRLCRETKKLLHERKIVCPVEWVADGMIFELKGEA